MNDKIEVEVALIHAPVVNRLGETIGSAVTNLDLHDISRAGRTYGILRFWVVTPYDEQKELVTQIVDHWTSGYGSKADTDRAEALSIIRISQSLDHALEKIVSETGTRPLVLATCAKKMVNAVGYHEVRKEIQAGRRVLLLFGTAWGLAPSLLMTADKVLLPIEGRGSFNHLSVRSAVSIILDRLLGDRE